MLGIRHEKYTDSTNKLPFYLSADIERTRFNISKEQNWHENLEIQLFTEGEGSVLLNGEKHTVKKGDIVLVNSNILHYTFTETHLVYTCIIISNEWCRRMNIDYDSLHFCSLIRNDKLRNLFSQLKSVYLDTKYKLRIAKSNEILLNIMIELIEKHCDSFDSVQEKSRYFETIIKTIDYIHENFNQKITLTKIAEIVFFDKYTLCKEFKKYTGQTIFEYINHYRSIKAIDFLAEGCTVSQAAGLCGFENLSFFTKTFKKYIGTTPSEYKKSRL